MSYRKRNRRPRSNRNLYFLVCEGDLDSVREILKRKTTDVNDGYVSYGSYQEDYRSDVPIAAACKKGHLEIVKELLKHPKIEINRGYIEFYGYDEEDREFTTPLSYSCEKGNLEIVKILLQRDDLDVNKLRQSLQYFSAADNFDQDCSSYNIPRKHYDTPLFYACKDNHLEIVKELLLFPGIDVKIVLENVVVLDEKKQKIPEKPKEERNSRYKQGENEIKVGKGEEEEEENPYDGNPYEGVRRKSKIEISENCMNLLMNYSPLRGKTYLQNKALYSLIARENEDLRERLTYFFDSREREQGNFLEIKVGVDFSISHPKLFFLL